MPADIKDKIAEMIADAERAAYKRGWDDARAAILESANHLNSDSPEDDPPMENSQKRGRPASSTIEVVRGCITSTPGLRGVEIIKAARSVDPNVKERTVRTCLRRLRENKIIWQRTGRWYPKPRNDFGEAHNTPPH